MAYPPVTSLGTVPQRTQTPAEFATNADSLLGALPNFRTELNTFGAYVDTKGAEVDADAAAAANSALQSQNSASASDASAALALFYKDLAAGTANFKGLWSALTGSLAVPASVYHNGLTWVLLSNLANVTTAEPGISASWVVASGDSYQRLVDNILKRATLDLDFSANSHKVYEQFGLEPKQLQSVVVTSRNSTATYQSPTAIATSAINAPRITYDAATGNALGLLVEEQRTRLNTASANVTAAQNATVTAAAHAISFYGTGSVVLTGAHSATLVGTGSGRVTLTFTPTAGTLTMTPSGSVADLQLELGVAATSIIRGNEGSQVTRLADVISRALATTNANAGAIFCEFDLTSYNKSGNATIVSLNGSPQTSERGFALTVDNNSVQAWVRNASSVRDASVTVPDSLQPIKALVSFDNTSLKVLVSVNGVTSEQVMASAIDISSFVSNLYVSGGVRISGSAAVYSKTVKRCTYFPRSFTAAEAQAITA